MLGGAKWQVNAQPRGPTAANELLLEASLDFFGGAQLPVFRNPLPIFYGVFIQTLCGARSNKNRWRSETKRETKGGRLELLKFMEAKAIVSGELEGRTLTVQTIGPVSKVR